jgi:hypothetical protein
MDNPYETPGASRHLPSLPGAPPAVVFWYRVYAAALALLYLFVTLAGVAALLFRDQLVDETTSPEEVVIAGAVFVLMGGFFFVVYAFGTLIPAQPWAWIVGLVLIALGLTSCCCLPISIPLLIFWLKPEAQAYFGRVPAVSSRNA